MQWLERLQVALIEEDIDTMLVLLKEIPTFDTVEKMQKAQALIGQSIQLFQREKSKIAQQMQSIRASQTFLENKEEDRAHRLNLTS